MNVVYYIISGATGLVGRNLVDELINAGKTKIIALGRNKEILNSIASDDVIPVTLDLTWPYEQIEASLQPYLGSESYFFHVAAAVSGASDDILQTVNIEGTAKVVQLCETYGIRKLIHVSSISVYCMDPPGPFTETQPLGPTSSYGRSKLAAEETVRQSSLTWVMVRPPYIGGPYDQNFLKEISDRIRNGKMVLFSKVGSIGYIDARDVAKILIDLADSSIEMKAYNIQAQAIQFDEFIDQVGETLQLQSPYAKTLPEKPVLAVLHVSDFFRKLMGKNTERGLSVYRVKSLMTNRTLTTDQIDIDLSYSYTYKLTQSLNDWQSLIQKD